MENFAMWSSPSNIMDGMSNDGLQMETLVELQDNGFEPQTRARSNTWPLPRPDNFVEPCDETENNNCSNQQLSGKSCDKDVRRCHRKTVSWIIENVRLILNAVNCPFTRTWSFVIFICGGHEHLSCSKVIILRPREALMMMFVEDLCPFGYMQKLGLRLHCNLLSLQNIEGDLQISMACLEE